MRGSPGCMFTELLTSNWVGNPGAGLGNFLVNLEQALAFCTIRSVKSSVKYVCIVATGKSVLGSLLASLAGASSPCHSQ